MRPLRTLLAIALSTALLTGVTGCASNAVAARVNGVEITNAELDQQVEIVKSQYPGMFDDENGQEQLLEFKRSLLSSMIDQILIRQAAEERGITVADEEIDEQIDNIRMQVDDLDAALAEANMTMDDLRQQLSDQLVHQKLVEDLDTGETITDAEIESYYEANIARFTESASQHAAHILFDPDDRETAERVLAEARAGADFGELAEEYSKDPGSAARGGDLGWSDPSRPYVPEFEAALAELEPGEISDLIETDFGWHIITVIDAREESTQPLSEARSTIEQMIGQQRSTDVFQAFLAEIREAAEIEILAPELRETMEEPTADPTMEPIDPPTADE